MRFNQFFLILLIVSVVLVSACEPSVNESTDNKEKGVDNQKNNVQLKGFDVYSSAEGRFSVLLPPNPEKELHLVNTELGAIPLIMVHALKDDISYGVAYMDYPEGFVESVDIPGLLDASRDGMVENTGGKLTSELIISMDGYPGRDIKIKIGDAALENEIYLVNDRLYQVNVASGNAADLNLKSVTAFFDSFSLISTF